MVSILVAVGALRRRPRRSCGTAKTRRIAPVLAVCAVAMMRPNKVVA
jgi:hypothetical protein